MQRDVVGNIKGSGVHIQGNLHKLREGHHHGHNQKHLPLGFPASGSHEWDKPDAKSQKQQEHCKMLCRVGRKQVGCVKKGIQESISFALTELRCLTGIEQFEAH